MKKFSFGRQRALPGCVSTVLLALFMLAILPISAYSADRLVVKRDLGTPFSFAVYKLSLIC
jgi:hypothetical protein